MAKKNSSNADPGQRLIIADTDPDFLKWAERHLAAPSLEIITTTSAEEALQRFEAEPADLLLAEIQLHPFDGLTLLKRIRMNYPDAMVLLNGTITSTNAVIEATRLGAYDVIRREATAFELRPTVEAALQAAEQMRRVGEAEKESQANTPGKTTAPADTDLIIGRSPAMQDVFKLIGRVARADAPVLITGESGVGKEVVANAIHQYSRRASGEYVAINCAAIPGNLLESELFGHEKGAFTGAVSQRVGRFEQCDGGTLFLDEIGDMPLEVQSKLLRVLQSGEFARVGGNATLHSDVRILAATNKHLEQEVEDGGFREDLFYRLNVIRIHIPPLRQRREDVPLLAEHFLSRLSKQAPARRITLSPEALELLQNHDWPGNVRELENTLQRASVLATGTVLLPQDLPLGQAPRTGIKAKSGDVLTLAQAATALLAAAAESAGDDGVLALAERELVQAALSFLEGDETAAAKLLGITKATLKKCLAATETS
jgi:DNA-binding NtrC family response regulator